VPCMSRAHLSKSSVKISNIQINFIEPSKQVYFFPEGVSPLWAGLKPEPLVSRKVVCCEASTKGSETTKSGSDEQKRHIRLLNEDKQAHLCNVPRTPKSFFSRCRSN